jgi:hypothetical protein|nr:MAG TPA: Minor capsid protein from bacteriophage [Caudoviricetes sp.]
MSSNNKPKVSVPAAERNKIDRKVLAWLNQYPDLPVSVIKTEPQLPINEKGMALSASTNAYYSRRYIMGGYQAEYSFRIIYRIKPGDSMNARLEALEALNQMGDWCSENLPSLGDEIRVLKVSPTSSAELYGPYENGDEDYFIEMSLTYEVGV